MHLHGCVTWADALPFLIGMQRFMRPAPCLRRASAAHKCALRYAGSRLVAILHSEQQSCM